MELDFLVVQDVVGYGDGDGIVGPIQWYQEGRWVSKVTMCVSKANKNG